MDVNVALIGVGLLMALFIAAGLYLEGHQHASRAVPVLRPVYRSDRTRLRR